MSDNKRIRVSADTSPLQGLRREVESMWNDFNQMEGRFKDISEKALDVIQHQIDLLKERNALLSPNGLNFGSSSNGRGLIIDPYTNRPYDLNNRLNNTDPLRGNNVFLNKIISELSKISNLLEKSDRDRKNNDNVDNSGNEDNIINNPNNPSRRNRKFNIPTSFSSLLKTLPFGIGAIALAIGGAAGKEAQFRTQLYGAENKYERENLRSKHWLLNAITFGIPGQFAERREMDRRALQNFEEPLSEFSSISGLSTLDAAAAILSGNYTNRGQIGLTVSKSIIPNKNLSGYPDALSVKRNMPVLGSSTIEFSKESNEAFAELGLTPDLSPKQINTRISSVKGSGSGYDVTGGFSNNEMENANWRTKYLGMNSSDYLQKISSLLRAGAYDKITGGKFGDGNLNNDWEFFNNYFANANQVLLWGKARGLSDEQQANLLKTNRFGYGLSASDIIASFNANLVNAGYNGIPLSVRLGENLDAYNRFANQILNVAGSVNLRELTGTMTGVQSVTGMQGQQLERVQEFLTGTNVSQDAVTKAIMLTEARKMMPDATYSELMAAIENPNQSGLMKNVIKSIYEYSGGGERFRTTLKSIAPGLHWNDIIDLDRSLSNAANRSDSTYQEIIDRIFNGTISSSNPNKIAAEAAATVTEQQRSSAASEEYHIVAGADRYLKGGGEKGDIAFAIEQALLNSTFKIVDTSPDKLTYEVLARCIQEGVSEGLKNLHVEIVN